MTKVIFLGKAYELVPDSYLSSASRGGLSPCSNCIFESNPEHMCGYEGRMHFESLDGGEVQSCIEGKHHYEEVQP